MNTSEVSAVRLFCQDKITATELLDSFFILDRPLDTVLFLVAAATIVLKRAKLGLKTFVDDELDLLQRPGGLKATRLKDLRKLAKERGQSWMGRKQEIYERLDSWYQMQNRDTIFIRRANEILAAYNPSGSGLLGEACKDNIDCVSGNCEDGVCNVDQCSTNSAWFTDTLGGCLQKDFAVSRYGHDLTTKQERDKYNKEVVRIGPEDPTIKNVAQGILPPVKYPIDILPIPKDFKADMVRNKNYRVSLIGLENVDDYAHDDLLLTPEGKCYVISEALDTWNAGFALMDSESHRVRPSYPLDPFTRDESMLPRDVLAVIQKGLQTGKFGEGGKDLRDTPLFLFYTIRGLLTDVYNVNKKLDTLFLHYAFNPEDNPAVWDKRDLLGRAMVLELASKYKIQDVYARLYNNIHSGRNAPQTFITCFMTKLFRQKDYAFEKIYPKLERCQICWTEQPQDPVQPRCCPKQPNSCKVCLRQWALKKGTCPTCRKPLLSENLVPLEGKWTWVRSRGPCTLWGQLNPCRTCIPNLVV